MTSIGNPGRFAGLLYLLTSIVGFFAMVYVPERLIVSGDALTTAHNIASNEMLFRIGIAPQLSARLDLSLWPWLCTIC